MNKCNKCGKNTELSVNGYVCTNPECSEYKSSIKSDAFKVNEESIDSKKKILKKGDFVFDKTMGIYGYIENSWKAYDDDNVLKMNYIITDMMNIEHERWENEIELVDNIEDSIKKAKCNVPLEKLIELFNVINNKYKLTIEVSKSKENAHSDIYVPYVFVKYGNIVYNSNESKFHESTCYIRDGKLFLPEEENYVGKENEYECALSYYDTDVKYVVFELYMNIICRLKK